MKDITKLQKTSILSLLIIVGLIITMTSSNTIIVCIGWIFCGIGSFNFGKMIALMHD